MTTDLHILLGRHTLALKRRDLSVLSLFFPSHPCYFAISCKKCEGESVSRLACPIIFALSNRRGTFNYGVLLLLHESIIGKVTLAKGKSCTDKEEGKKSNHRIVIIDQRSTGEQESLVSHFFSYLLPPTQLAPSSWSRKEAKRLWTIAD